MSIMGKAVKGVMSPTGLAAIGLLGSFGDRKRQYSRDKEAYGAYKSQLRGLEGAEQPIEEMYGAQQEIISADRYRQMDILGLSLKDMLGQGRANEAKSGFADSGVAQNTMIQGLEKGSLEAEGISSQYGERSLSAYQGFQDQLTQLEETRNQLKAQMASVKPQKPGVLGQALGTIGSLF